MDLHTSAARIEQSRLIRLDKSITVYCGTVSLNDCRSDNFSNNFASVG
jgi:hypothetical protein